MDHNRLRVTAIGTGCAVLALAAVAALGHATAPRVITSVPTGTPATLTTPPPSYDPATVPSIGVLEPVRPSTETVTVTRPGPGHTSTATKTVEHTTTQTATATATVTQTETATRTATETQTETATATVTVTVPAVPTP